MTQRTPPTDDAVLGIILVAITFGVAVAYGAVFVAVITGLMLAVAVLAFV